MNPRTVSVREATDDNVPVLWICPEGDPDEVWEVVQPRCPTCGALLMRAIR